MLDFDDLLLYWRVAARMTPWAKSSAQPYDHILVDEFQDVNLLQLDVLVGLRRIDPRLTIVGDDAQAIYGFVARRRGSCSMPRTTSMISPRSPWTSTTARRRDPWGG